MPKEVTKIGVFSFPGGRASRASEFDSALKGDHARRAVAAEADAEQSGGRRDGAGQRAKSRLRGRLAWSACLIGGQRKVGVIEDVEELRVEAEALRAR